MNISEISDFLIKYPSIVNINSIFENYLFQISQPNNYILQLFTFDNYTFETFMKKLDEFDLSDALIKIKLNDKIITSKYKNIDKIIDKYYNDAIDIIIIFYFDSIKQISYKEIKNLISYYKRKYIIHCQNIRNLQSMINSCVNHQQLTEIEDEKYKEMKEDIEHLKMKNLTLCCELDQLKLSSQENINYSNNEYLKLQLEYENLEQSNHDLKSKLHKYKNKLKEYTNENKQLNENIIKLQKENKQLKNDNDEFYISIVNGFNESKIKYSSKK